MSELEHDYERAIETLKDAKDKTVEAALHEAASTNMRPGSLHERERPRPKRREGDPGVKRQENGEILVYGKNEVMEVFLNAEGNYTVSGYAERSSKAFGEFFLGMDACPAYNEQSGAINKAISAITLEDGFHAGMVATNKVLPTMDEDELDQAKLVDGMLAEVCKPLFGIPDGHCIIGGGLEFHLFSPGRCPGDYAPLSAYIFLPDPGFLVNIAGRHLGGVLKEQTAEFIAELRKVGKPPEAPLTRVLYETIPPEQDDLFARTLVGIMMGLLPTTEGNMEQILKHLHADGTYYQLAEKILALPDPVDPDAAVKILHDPMCKAMQAGPMPPAVWRKATRDHMLGPVAVREGDKINISIKNATMEDLRAGKVNVDAIFGGNRAHDPWPLHACPGYQLAMGIMFGTLVATMKSGR